jgi:hypothetical protein
MMRWLYGFLVRLHPGRFRQRFGEQMLSIFDESVRERSRLRLVMDAFASMFRQRVLRAGYEWQRQVLPSGLPLSALHQVSEQLQKKARRIHFMWMTFALPLSVVVAVWVQPVNKTNMAEAAYLTLLPAMFVSLYVVFNQSSCSLTFIGITERPSSLASLQQKFDRFERWSDQMGLVLMYGVALWILPVVFGFLLGKPFKAHSWAVVNFTVFAIQSLIFFAVVRPISRRAASALHQEMEAVSTPNE